MKPALSAWVQWVDASGRPTPVFLAYTLGQDGAIKANTNAHASLSDQVSSLSKTVSNLPTTISARWGGISGNLYDQSDLQSALDAKGNIDGQTWTGSHNFTGGTVTVADAVAGTQPTPLEQVNSLIAAKVSYLPMVNGDTPPGFMYFDDGSLFLLEVS